MSIEHNLSHFAADPAAAEEPPADGRYNSMLACLVMIARTQGLTLSEQQLALDNQLVADRVAPQELVFVAERAGMRARVVRPSVESLLELRRACPVVVTLKSGGTMVLNAVWEAPGGLTSVELLDPHAEAGEAVRMDILRFEQGWAGDVLLAKRVFRMRDENQPFSVRFISGLVLRERRLVRDVAIAALFIGALQVAPILYFRLLTSDVINYDARNTFWLLVAVIVWVTAFQAGFLALRSYLVSIITARVDARMNEYIYEKVLNLPIDFFERTPVGEISHNFNEVYKIRDFLGGQLFGTCLDAAVLLFFLPLMFYVSWLMTAVVLVSMAVMMAVIVLTLPSLRAATGRLIRARVNRGSFMYQTFAGIRTVKSLALESRQRARWDTLTADVSRKDFELSGTANLLRAAVFPLEQMALTGAFTIGAYQALMAHSLLYAAYLFVFMMLSQKVISPLIQLAKLVEQYDEVRLAVEVISSMINRPPEENAGEHGVRKRLAGYVEFSNLRFKYPGSQSYALDGITFDVPIGKTLGIVGRSGSGKTTVTRLLQRLHSEYDGLIKVDGVDVREYDLAHLRRSLGVVLQENFLFSGTIRENIVAAKPSASFDEVVNACRLAGAEEFIDRLPRGYDTFIYEGSPNLSGGQKQRLAIARALIVDPRILILDEATSALDPDSEAIVNDNIRRIAEGRTMLVISHRLSSLVNSDAILVLERGKVADIGPHAELLERCEIYRNLWNQQNRHTAGPARATLRGPTRVS